MKKAAILFVFVLILPIANAQLIVLDQEHKTKSFSQEITLFEKLSGLLSSLIRNNNTIAKQRVVSFRKLDGLNFTSRMHNSTSNMFGINVAYLTLEELCSDSIQNGDEEGIDCGGSCPNSCSMGAFDLSIESRDILFEKNNIKANIHNKGYRFIHDAEIIAVNTNTLENATKTVDIKGNGNITVDFNLTINEGDTLLVQLDYNNRINETNEKNNFAFRKFEGFPFVFVSADLDIDNLEQEFIDYIKDNLKSSYYTNNENNANIKIYIGKNNLVNKQKLFFTKNNFGYYYDFGNIYYKDKVGSLPYNGLISAFNENNTINQNNIINILIYGNEIDGTIAAAKEFINKEAEFINVGNENSFFVDDENLIAVKVFDFLHNTGNGDNYLLDNNAFKNIVRNALRDDMFTEKDYTVISGSGVNLRLRNLKPNASDMYLLYLNSTGVPVELPVVLARGIHSNLSTWQVLASELANEGRDSWLIEITGGPGTECDTCPNYDFSDLTDDYWPTLINRVLSLTGKDQIQYVGHSNGGRVAIVSLANGAINPSKIDTLIGVAVPSAFEGYSTFGYYFGKYGEQIMKELEGKNHVSMTEIASKMETICLNKADFGCFILTKGLKSENKMSFNVDRQYYLWINDTNDSQIGKNLNLDNFYIIQGWVKDDEQNNISHDFIVTEQDEKAIYGNVASSNKKHYKVWGAHTAGWDIASLPDRDFTKSIIKDILNKKSLNEYKSNEINST